MYIMHNKIHTSTKQVPTLSELFKRTRTQAALEKSASTEVVKTASAVETPAPVKEAKGDPNFGGKKAPPFGSKGKDEKKDGKDDAKEEKGNPFAKKEEKEACGPTCACSKCKSAKASKAKTAEKEQDEAPSSGQPEAEAKLVNDPKLPEGEGKAKGGKAKADKEEAETSGQPQAEAKLVNHPKVEDNKEARTTGEAGKVKVARYMKIAELSGKQKDFLRKVYEIYWPKEFIDALLAKQ